MKEKTKYLSASHFVSFAHTKKITKVIRSVGHKYVAQEQIVLRSYEERKMAVTLKHNIPLVGDTTARMFGTSSSISLTHSNLLRSLFRGGGKICALYIKSKYPLETCTYVQIFQFTVPLVKLLPRGFEQG